MLKLLLFLLPLSLWAKNFVPDSFRAKFTQTFKSTLTDKVKKSEGTLEYLYPGQFKFEVTSPEPSTVVSDSKTSWYYTPPFISGEEGEVIIRPGSGPFLTEFFDALRSWPKSNKLFTLEKKDDHYLAIFSKDFAKKIGKKETKLFFKTANPQGLSELTEMVIVGQDKTEVRLVLSSLVQNPSYPTGHFHFQVPPNTRISK